MRQFSSPAAEERYPEYFRLADNVIGQLVTWLHSGEIRVPENALEAVKLGCATRAANLFRSIVLLLRTDHWEDASILNRSLFELLLNLEEVLRRDADTQQQAQKFLLYERLQNYLHKRARLDHEVAAGRMTPNEKLLDRSDSAANRLFRIFLDPKKKGTGIRWKRSWCGKNVWQLAEASSQQPIRVRQYEVLYPEMSAFSHSSPLSVMSTVYLAQDEQELEDHPKRAEDRERQQLLEVLGFATTFTLEIVFRGRDMIPGYKPDWNFEVLRSLYDFHGAEPPE